MHDNPGLKIKPVLVALSWWGAARENGGAKKGERGLIQSNYPIARRGYQKEVSEHMACILSFMD